MKTIAEPSPQTRPPDSIALHISTNRAPGTTSFGVLSGEFGQAWVKLIKLSFASSPRLADIIAPEEIQGMLIGPDGIFILSVYDWRRAVDAVKRELESLGIANHCRIAWYDSSEGIWRHAFPKDRTHFDPVALVAAWSEFIQATLDLQAAEKDVAAITSKLDAMKKRKESGSQPS